MLSGYVDLQRSPLVEALNLSKLAEGGFHRTFLLIFCDDFQMIAGIPYPATVPKYYAVASEVATMEFLRSSGLPVPQVYTRLRRTTSGRASTALWNL